METSPQPEATTPEPEADSKKAGSRQGWLFSTLVFVGTLLGSLLGAAAELSDASGLVVPVLESVRPAPELHIAGSNSVLGEGIGMAEVWRQEFTAQKAWETNVPLIGSVDRTVEVTVDAGGSLAGFDRALEGEVDLLVESTHMSHPQYQQLAAAGIEVQCAAEIGYDAIAFVTNIDNTVPPISRRDMRSILHGSITNWSQVGGEPGPIRILAREGSGTTSIVLQRFTNSTAFQVDYIPCGSNDECLDRALSTPGSLYWVSTSWLRTQPPRYLRLILIPIEAGVAPEDPLKPLCSNAQEECFNPDRYPPELLRPLYMYVLRSHVSDPESTALAREFLYYVRGVNGQEILENHYFYTHFDPPPEVEPELPEGFGMGNNGLPIVCRDS